MDRDESRRRSRRGPEPLDPSEKRRHCVSVRLNAAELRQLDVRRSPYQRGEWLRIAALDQLPPTIPQINRDAWVQLARSAANLNQIARAVNSGEAVEAEAIREALAGFRHALIGAGGQFDDESDA